MTPRDKYFLTNHLAAHIVTALLLGCKVEYVDVSASSNAVSWNLDSASLGDVDTVCGAGFQMERILGRMHDSVWERSQDDRVLLGSIHADRTGLTLTPKEIDELFMAGATSSQALLDHKGTRAAIDQLSEILYDASLNGQTRVTADEMKAVKDLITGVGSQA